ncbi:cell division protein FtsL [Pelagibacterium lentulum]|uniref:Cell division protein FtsL n=1 Tax=Pelagibacterium lentulum TaxID=2029865 RepID=A0A916VWT8_9HYPH|nr:hypothetical protein [Pelagibacterium lentulum]GGA46671.1 hypothetical protein GCM10011499_15520 [Pelagibacterium lentulum]
MNSLLHKINVLLAVVSMFALVGVYAQKHMAELTAAEIRSIENAIAKQQADLSILRADWAYLNQPTQIQPIIKRHSEELNLQMAKASQFGSIDAIPMRPQMRLDTDALDALFQSIEEGEDPIGALLEGLL